MGRKVHGAGRAGRAKRNAANVKSAPITNAPAGHHQAKLRPEPRPSGSAVAAGAITLTISGFLLIVAACEPPSRAFSWEILMMWLTSRRASPPALRTPRAPESQSAGD